MRTELGTPDVGQRDDVVAALRTWQHDAAPLQLHPGDLGWFWRFGAEATAAALRVWHNAGDIVAVGLLDGPGLVRMTVTPAGWSDDALADQLVADLSAPEPGVLPSGQVSVEAPNGSALQRRLDVAGWTAGEAWTPLRRELGGPIPESALHVEVIDQERRSAYAAVIRSAFDSTRFTDDRWSAMAAGSPYVDARSLLAFDHEGHAVSAVNVWSAGRGKPGLIEPLGVHAEHRGHGYGRELCVAAAATLQGLGSSSVVVCTPSERSAAIATYRSAGFEALPERLDRTRAV